MIGFEAKMVADSGNDLGALIAQILADNALSVAQKSKLSADKFQNIVDRALTKTGSTLMYDLKAGLKGKKDFAPKRVYSKTGMIMSDIIAAARPGKASTARLLSALVNMGKKAAGEKFAGRMRFDIGEQPGSRDREIDVGLRKQDRSKGSWRQIFSTFQEAGNVNIYGSEPGSMRRYLAAIGLPIRKDTTLKRPARPIVDDTGKRLNPAQLFEKLFLERLLK
jgi:hypothetical protein